MSSDEKSRGGEERDHSGVVIRGLDATTFTQMEEFVAELEKRPVDRLLSDLPELAALSSTKFALVSYVIKARFERATADERLTIRRSIDISAAAEQEPATRERLTRLLERLRA